jgi:hypothetical protein
MASRDMKHKPTFVVKHHLQNLVSYCMPLYKINTLSYNRAYGHVTENWSPHNGEYQDYSF